MQADRQRLIVSKGLQGKAKQSKPNQTKSNQTKHENKETLRL